MQGKKQKVLHELVQRLCTVCSDGRGGLQGSHYAHVSVCRINVT